MNIRKQLKDLRKRHGLTQVELARKIGVGDQTVGAWERGRTAITLEDACKLADLYKISLDSLVDRNDFLNDHSSQEIRYYMTCLEEMTPEHRANVFDIVEALHRSDAIIEFINDNKTVA